MGHWQKESRKGGKQMERLRQEREGRCERPGIRTKV